MFSENMAVWLVMDNNCVNNTLIAVVVVVVVDVVGVDVGRRDGYAGHLCASRTRAGGRPRHPALHHRGVHLQTDHQRED